MMKLSAGILLYRGEGSSLELLLVHPGGPFWAKKDLGAWSIPKGEYAAGEDPFAVARREFEEELGAPSPQGALLNLGEIKQPSRKVITAFAARGDFDPASLKSNRFELEWPPRSGRLQSFPEVDRAAWFTPEAARVKILPGQAPFIDRLLETLRA
jgi:predicted NUDIX family NTP pyrophosphohydrolase